LYAARAVGFFIAKIKELLVLGKRTEYLAPKFNPSRPPISAKFALRSPLFASWKLFSPRSPACYFWGQRPTCPVLDVLGPAQIS
jgi:hypothetical protein